MKDIKFSEKAQIMLDMCIEEFGDPNYKRFETSNFERVGYKKTRGRFIVDLEIYHFGLIHIFTEHDKNTLISTNNLSQVKEMIDFFKQMTEGFECPSKN